MKSVIIFFTTKTLLFSQKCKQWQVKLSHTYCLHKVHRKFSANVRYVNVMECSYLCAVLYFVCLSRINFQQLLSWHTQPWTGCGASWSFHPIVLCPMSLCNPMYVSIGRSVLACSFVLCLPFPLFPCTLLSSAHFSVFLFFFCLKMWSSHRSLRTLIS